MAQELAALFRRDITRLGQQIPAFPEEQMLWATVPGVTNSAGNLILHLEGNLREYIGRQIGQRPYSRRRDDEFSLTGVPAEDLCRRIGQVGELVSGVVARLSDEQLRAVYPENVFGQALSTHQFLIHLHGHLNYHLGQIDYLRRVLSGGMAIQYAGL